MILYELTGQSEEHPAYQSMEVANGSRHYDFLRSAVEAALAIDGPFLSQTVLKAINYHAIACLHPYAGEYRPCPVTVGEYVPPEHYRVGALMDDFVNRVNRYWDKCDPVMLSAYVLWRLNHIHPFINGNGRTARAASYFVLCLKLKGWPPGKTILPELLRQPGNRAKYVQALRDSDEAAKKGEIDVSRLVALFNELLTEQLSSAGDEGGST